MKLDEWQVNFWLKEAAVVKISAELSERCGRTGGLQKNCPPVRSTPSVRIGSLTAFDRITMHVAQARFIGAVSALGGYSGASGKGAFYDFNVWSEPKWIEKLLYMHRNPVKRRLVEQTEHLKSSSFRAYFYGEPGLVRVNFQEWRLEIKSRPLETFKPERRTR